MRPIKLFGHRLKTRRQLSRIGERLLELTQCDLILPGPDDLLTSVTHGSLALRRADVRSS